MKHDCSNCDFFKENQCTYVLGTINAKPFTRETSNDDECCMWEPNDKVRKMLLMKEVTV